MKKEKNNYKLSDPFFPVFNSIIQCSEIRTIKDHVEIKIPWDIESSLIYCFIYSRYSYHNKTFMSYDYISSELNISPSTVTNRIKRMRDYGIIETYSKKDWQGRQMSNNYIRVDFILNTEQYKLITNKYKKAYKKKINDRKKRLELLKGVCVDHTWSREQARYFWDNTRHELITGEFLQGDKTAGILYKREAKVIREALKEYEFLELEKEMGFNYD